MRNPFGDSVGNPSGGLGYHLAAVYSVRGAWRPFREALARELAARIPDPERATLTLVGPSGGYCLDPAWLGRFARTVAVDVDPLALAILRFRFRSLGPRLETRRADFFAEGPASFAPAPGTRSVLLFSNLLGQLEFLHRGDALAQAQARVREILAGAPEWTSFHDRLTSEAKLFRNPSRQGPLRAFAVRPEAAELARAWWGGPRNDDPRARGGPPEVAEHELGDWWRLARGDFAYLPWRLDPSRTQLVEVCGSGPATA